MAEDDPVRICLDELRGSDEVGAAWEMARERRAALLGREGVASGLVAVAMNADDGDRAPGLALFRALIHEAGEDRENRGSLGGRFLEEAAKSIEALVAREELDADAALELTDAYARGEVEAPEALVAWLMARLEALARSEAGTGMEVFDEEIERVRQAADEDDHDLYRVVDKWLDVFPRAEEGRDRAPYRGADGGFRGQARALLAAGSRRRKYVWPPQEASTAG